MTTRWTRYYDAAGDQPRETLLIALERFETEAEYRRRFNTDPLTPVEC
jgi:hypothetical protein